MTKEQFNEIKERLAKWREERKLTYENQRERFLGNSYEEVSEYFRANNSLERIDALCDIVILCFNAFNLNYTEMKIIRYDEPESISISDITYDLSFITSSFMNYNFKSPSNIYRLILDCKYLSKNLGYNFYGCMLEAIKEIESRSGYYDPEIKKFVKNKGAYSFACVAKEYPGSKYSIAETEKDFIVFNERGGTEAFLDKWYKADYSKYYIGD